MEAFWQAMGYSFSVIFPLVALLFFGRFLRISGQIREAFLQDSDALLYRYGIPALLF